ncbi:hypothetical protein HOLleu_26071 [Holothuria leucospilota]|uniref:Uncharacterized protein n=1 Tax=Holothuria leucospilota TaxID=206669 RepID=A0A9Q1H4U0_HOLLE|nr:hypothetical protein HOLleu_26071 [Holothuria leucospilota]
MKKTAGLDGLDFKSKPKSESRKPESESKSKSRKLKSKSKSESKRSGLKSGLEVKSGLESSSPAKWDAGLYPSPSDPIPGEFRFQFRLYHGPS